MSSCDGNMLLPVVQKSLFLAKYVLKVPLL